MAMISTMRFVFGAMVRSSDVYLSLEILCQYRELELAGQFSKSMRFGKPVGKKCLETLKKLVEGEG